LYTIETFTNPVKLQDTKISDGDTLTRKHRETTCRIISKLYAYDYVNTDGVDLTGPNSMFSNYEKLKQKFLGQLLSEISDGNADSVKLLANSLSILAESGKYPKIIPDFQDQLKNIYNTNVFKLTVRLAVKDFILDAV
jgi:hypothetical protein